MKRFRSFLQRRKSRQQASTPAQAAAPRQEERATAQQPLQAAPEKTQAVAATGATLTLNLQNRTSSNNVFAYVTGQALDNNNALFLLQADARTPYFPSSPSSTMSGLAANCAINLGAPGNTVQARIPHIAGGRIWFSVGSPLTFYLNPGPALVEPSVANPADPNINLNWGFAEFTFNSDQLYANISYVDFVGPPIALNLTTFNSGTQNVTGLAPNGLQQIANALNQQNNSDHAGWNQLIVNRQGTNTPLRVLSPNIGRVGNPSLFNNYFEPYVDQVWGHYTGSNLNIDSQAAAGTVSGRVVNGQFQFGGNSFVRPSTSDIFTCSTGPFQTGSDATRNALIPRLAAAFNRSTLLVSSNIPAPQNDYYKNNITNHYSRVVHAANSDGKGYAFPYDDVQPNGGTDASGKVQAGDPNVFTVTISGS